MKEIEIKKEDLQEIQASFDAANRAEEAYYMAGNHAVGRQKSMWRLIKAQYPEMEGFACRLDMKTGVIKVLYPDPNYLKDESE